MRVKSILVILLVLAVSLPAAAQAPKSKSATVQWEYTTQYFWEWTTADKVDPRFARDTVHAGRMNEVLSGLGAKGWEVVALTAVNGAFPDDKDPYRSLNHLVVILRRAK
jgi:hypothetical protein